MAALPALRDQTGQAVRRLERPRVSVLHAAGIPKVTDALRRVIEVLARAVIVAIVRAASAED